MDNFQQILNRIQPNYSKSLDVHQGWHNLVFKLDSLLSYLSPNYTISQVKTKFGNLRYYASFVSQQNDPAPDLSKDIFDSLIRYYEYLSSMICEYCGAHGKLIQVNGWYFTACSKHENITSQELNNV